ncbi:hypothetical protein EVAR_51457_1 [Eumeta japonica]|uniref:Uncharacterized protein n=1 Tax=Eumeta variegata TaxID=151549 RepID=A0A4C1XTM6_EUMVA|nr:hypothetical protein EVAR_51457_1 [Eumeta japonica]
MDRPTKHAAHRSHPYCKPLRSSIDHHIRLRQLLDHNDVTVAPSVSVRDRVTESPATDARATAVPTTRCFVVSSFYLGAIQVCPSYDLFTSDGGDEASVFEKGLLLRIRVNETPAKTLTDLMHASRVDAAHPKLIHVHIYNSFWSNYTNEVMTSEADGITCLDAQSDR